MTKFSRTLRPFMLVVTMFLATSVLAASADKINREADKAIQVFREDINGAEVFLAQAAGYLVFPRVIKIGIGIGVTELLGQDSLVERQLRP